MTIKEILKKINNIAENMDFKAYAVGGYVRDQIMGNDSKDIDVVILGDSIKFTKELQKHFKTKDVAFFKTFMTTKVTIEEFEFEFVSARSESYDRNSRKPKVQTATIEEDLSRRDFTINAIAMHLGDNYGQLLDPYFGQEAIEDGIIKTPVSSEITFSDDPLRMIRAIRFASRFQFELEPSLIKSIHVHLKRLDIVSRERILVELEKMLIHKNVSLAVDLLINTGLFNYLFKLVDKANYQHIHSFYSSNSFDNWPFEYHIAYFLRFNINKKSQITAFLKELKCSNKSISTINKLLSLEKYYVKMSSTISLADQFKFIYYCGQNFKSYLIYFNKIHSNHNDKFLKKLTELDQIYSFSDFQLAINGNELSVLSQKSGKDLGRLIDQIRELILNNEIQNNKNQIIDYLRNNKI